MFSVYCPRHRSAVLLGIDGIVRLRARPGRFEISWRCSCGETGDTTVAAAEVAA